MKRGRPFSILFIKENIGCLVLPNGAVILNSKILSAGKFSFDRQRQFRVRTPLTAKMNPIFRRVRNIGKSDY